MRPNGTEKYANLMPHVRIHARIVPNGAKRNGETDKALRATLLLSPELVPKEQKGGVRLDQWPGEIHALLKDGVAALVMPVASGAENGAGKVAPGPRTPITFTAPGLARLSEPKDIRALCDMWLGSLWQEVPEKANVVPESWKALGQAITTSLTGTAVNSCGMKEANDQKPETNLYGADGQLAPAEAAGNSQKLTVVAALDIRHADLAVTLEDQRAKALAASLKLACEGAKRPDAPALDRPEVPGNEADWANDVSVHVSYKDNDPLIKAIATTKPRGTKETFKAYAARLAKKAAIEEDDAIIALRSDEKVIAELRRRRRVAERTALFEALEGQRKAASETYNKALEAITMDACIAPAPPEWRDQAVTPGKAAQGEGDFDDATRAARYANWPQYRTPEDEREKAERATEATKLERGALQSFFTMQSTPTLARAAMLAVDLELDLASVGAEGLKSLATNYAHIRADLPDIVETTQPLPWTLFRLRDLAPHAGEAAQRHHFWPVTREEADCLVTPPPVGSTRHFGGLMVMGFGADASAAANTPRFDITSLDIRTAVELELQRRSIAQANMEAGTEVAAQSDTNNKAVGDGAAATKNNALPPGVNLPGEATDIEDEGDRQDVGLTLLDRGLCAQAIRKMAARDAKMSDPTSEAVCKDDNEQGPPKDAIVLDGEDLITGYRLHIGTPGEGGTKWHPMMSRAIQFGTTGPYWRHSDRIEPLLRRLIGKAGGPERVALESAAINVPGRMLPKQSTLGADMALETEAVFEQAVSVWDGGPMGVDCAVRPGTEKTTPDTLIFGRKLSIPTGSQYAIPRLRYGRPYRFALAAVYSGGRSIGRVDFPREDLGEDTRADLFYPSRRMAVASQACAGEERDCVPPNVQPYVRALRQAKIGAPQVLLPEGHAKRDNGPMGPDKAGLMLVRSLDRDDKNPTDARFTSRGQPASARRIVLIPSIPLDRAAGHMGEPSGETSKAESALKGVFDNLKTTPTTKGGLTFVRQQKGDCGFPAIKTRYLKGLNGVQHFDQREVEDNPSDAALKEGEELDGAIFEAGTAPGSAYYPDPAAETLAIRVRLQGGTGRWLTMDEAGIGPIDLIGGQTYPDRRRALMVLKQHKSREQVPGSLSELLTLKDNRWFNPAHQGSSEATGRFHAREVTLRLAPHEWAEVEMWLVPSAKRLARDFAVIQALGVMIAQTPAANIAATIKGVCEGAKLCLPEDVTEQLVEVLRGSGGGQAFFGPGGVTVPPMQALLALAEVVRGCMISHPIPEISGVARLQAVHAANRATAKPHITSSKDAAAITECAPEPANLEIVAGLQPLRAFRPEEHRAGPPPRPDETETGTDAGETKSTKNDLQPPKVCTDIKGPLKVASKGSTGLVLTGDVELDLNQIDTIEVRARMAFPGSTTFDDRLRGRSLSLRRAGWWPLVDKPSGAPPEGLNGGVFRDSQSLFGFHVRPDGRTVFDRAEVTLLRAEQLPRPDGTACTDRVKLRRLFEERDLGKVRVTERHLFPDGKARRMFVWVNGLPRTAQFMRTADRKLRTGDAWVASEGLHHEVGELVAGEDMRAQAQCRLSDEVEVVLPATVRPAKPEARAPVPSFCNDTPTPAAKGLDMLIHRRRSVIRIPLGREWFSSGEDERLGIVLWPPRISPDDNWKLSQNKVTLRRHVDFGGDREIDLNDLRQYRLTKLKLVDILCTPFGGVADNTRMPFEDDHLGPGGRFVSRRGADPVREGNPHRQILFGLGDFPDLDLDEDDPQRAELVEMVEMPLSDDESSEGEAIPGRGRLPPMMVSLLTYAPRFDAEKEQWYVDVTLEDSEAAETFVRFGLVRYQPHTRSGLRCSRPVQQFVQPLPDRIADVTRIPRAMGGGVRVRLCGQTFYRRRVSEALRELMTPKSEAAPEGDPFDLAGCNAEDVSDLWQGADAAPRMKVTLFRNGTDASKRPYRETVPIPVKKVGREHGLLLPADHDTGVIGAENFAGMSGHDSFRINPEHETSAGSVAVKAAFTAEGEGIWLLKIPEEVIGGFKGLELQVEEVEAIEPADPPTFDELARAPVQSRIDVHALEDEKTFDTGTPNARVNGLHHGGARMRAIFDLSGWADD